MNEGYYKSKLVFIDEPISLKSKRRGNKQAKVTGAGERLGAQIPWKNYSLNRINAGT